MLIVDEDNYLVTWNPDNTLQEETGFALEVIDSGPFSGTGKTYSTTAIVDTVDWYETQVNSGETTVIEMADDTYCLDISIECIS